MALKAHSTLTLCIFPVSGVIQTWVHFVPHDLSGHFIAKLMKLLSIYPKGIMIISHTSACVV